MFHPIGPQTPGVYWRRRLVLIASVVLLVVLLVLTFNALRSHGGETAAAGSPTSSATSTRPAPSTTAPSRTTARSSSKAERSSSSGSRGASSSASSSSVVVPDCVVKSLQLRAATGKSDYSTTEDLMLQLQVTNTGTRPCVQNLSDSQVVMRVYNGESRVWGSHDCKIAPGTTDRTLTPRVPTVVTIKWGALTSRPGCAAGTRQRIGAGSYTLYATLSGVEAHATQFSIG